MDFGTGETLARETLAPTLFARDPREKSASASRFFLNAVLQQLPHTHLVRHAGEKRRSDKRRSGRGPRFYFFFSRPAILTVDIVFAFALFFSLSTLSSERERERERKGALPRLLSRSLLSPRRPHQRLHLIHPTRSESGGNVEDRPLKRETRREEQGFFSSDGIEL